MLRVLEVTPESLAYLVLGGFVVFFGVISLPLKERLYINEVVLGTAFGIILGPHCAGVFDPRSWGSTLEVGNRITLEVMRVVLAIGLFAIGVELPRSYLADHVRSLLVMVVPTMAFGWFIIALVIKALFPAFNYVSALIVTACLTPTDPVLAAAIIGGKFAIRNVPTHIRHLLSAESAANDGLAYPFLSISVYLATESSKKVAFGKWFLVGWLYQVIMGTIIGALLGLVFSHIMRFSHRKGLIDRESFVAQYLGLALFTIGIANTLGSDDLLAAFAAGSAVSWDGHFNERTEDEVFSTVIDLLLNCACFIYIGAWLPFQTYNDATLGIQPWRLVVLFLAILVIRRIPSILLLYNLVPDIQNWREALFCGHFGPMGVGAIFISTLALTELPKPNDPPRSQNELLAASLHPIVSFVVLGSIIIHGLSIPTFWFGKKSVRRTASLTNTLSRTWTSRFGADPEWLLSVDRAAKSETRNREGRTSRGTEDIERDVTDKADAGKEILGVRIQQAVASAGSSIRQEISRTTSVSTPPKSEGGSTGEPCVEDNSEGKRADEIDKSGEETAAFGYMVLHEAKENQEGDVHMHVLGDGGKTGRGSEGGAQRMVRFLGHESKGVEPDANENLSGD